jgi:hypothetical protein
MKLIPLLQRIKGWQLWMLLIVFSVIFSEITVTILYLLLKGEVSPLSQIVALMASILVATLLAPTYTHLLNALAASERIAIQASVERTQNHLNMAIHAAQMDLWEINLDTHLIRYTGPMIGLPGLSNENPPSTVEQWVALMHPDDIPPFMQRFQNALTSESGSFDFEYRVAQHDGQWNWVHSMGGVIKRDANKHPVLAAGTTIDTTSYGGWLPICGLVDSATATHLAPSTRHSERSRSMFVAG